MSIDSFGIHFGSLIYLRFYGVILITGAILGTYIASLEAKRKNMNPEIMWDALIWALIGGIVGARLYHVFTPPPSMVAAGLTTQAYFADPIKIFEVWRGGLGIPGGIVGGLFGLWLFARIKRLAIGKFVLYERTEDLKLLELIDLSAPALILGQAIGRWGNFVNQELYGKPTDLPWGIYIQPEYRLPGFTEFEKFHPTFLYESLLNLCIFFILIYASRRFADLLKTGDLFVIYLILYPTVRFFMEFLRLDSSSFGNLNLNQSLSALVAFLAFITFLIRHRRQRRVRSTPSDELPIA